MMYRNRVIVRYIWFCLELDVDCAKCAPARNVYRCAGVGRGRYLLPAIHLSPLHPEFGLLLTLSTWDLDSDLILDIS
ncbi:hypothetical protein F4860DRAFT_159849 [Xylaria cubensis]|nr:hypothetical protein F4860DRAFT_159849 [Xylaria cubensis]